MMRPGVLGIIPARGGSKRVPGKNWRELGGKPLIAWSIACAQRSGAFSMISVSTDDQRLADIASRCGAPVHALRPSELSTDDASSVSVVIHEIEQARRRGLEVQTVVLLQPTSPFRRASTIVRALSLFEERQQSVVTVSPLTARWDWCRAVQPDGTMRVVENPPTSLSRLNGLLYVADADTVIARGSLYSAHPVALVVDDPEETVDIDTELDWLFAEALIARRNRVPSGSD